LEDPLRLNALDRYREYGPVLLRILIGGELIRGTQDNVFSYARMLEFAGFLESHGVPLPLFAAFLSAYAQFLCGGLIILGLYTRAAGAVMVINFIAALVIAHIGQPYNANYPAFIMLAAAFFFMLHGAGKPSLDEWREKRGRT
jgi:putative oxidoreductase